ncbi:MAG: ABC transporter permease, partial [Acetobacteraceae bacterium]|nr:ABC transporter permease [Acetobacteraceae bacterium]
MTAGYLLRRLAQIVPTFLLIMVVVFCAVRLLPGDPVSALLGDHASDEAIRRLTAQMGLDRSIPEQFARFLAQFVRGDLGDSLVLKVPVTSLILDRLPVTLFLTAYAVVLALLLAFPLAFWAALRRERAADHAIRVAAQIGLSTPVFYVALVLLTVLAAQWRLFPVGGYGETFADRAYHLFLPALTLALSLSAILMRSLRGAIIAVMESDFIDFARSKGLRARVILGRHVLRNALTSTVTLLGLNIGSLVGGAVITETVFAIPGI